MYLKRRLLQKKGYLNEANVVKGRSLNPLPAHAFPRIAERTGMVPRIFLVSCCQRKTIDHVNPQAGQNAMQNTTRKLAASLPWYSAPTKAKIDSNSPLSYACC